MYIMQPFLNGHITHWMSIYPFKCSQPLCLCIYLVPQMFLKTQFLVTGCHNPVMQQSVETDISSKEIPYVAMAIT